MKYVKAEWNPDLPGFHVDPSAYLAELPRLSESLPPGARQFATAQDHYSFRSTRCVKDLELSGIHVPVGRNERMTIRFAPNEWKHDDGLRIEYVGVTHFSLQRDGEIDWTEIESVVLDEVTPTPDGCVHEIALTDSTILVRCSDLWATWGG
ncbi:hypothetical protein ACGFY8_05325 [Streptomyces sp. NPDC048232]|uniref:hypothetical protein n=1 Tax=unclassified Streptomyces TaxID=2593676 RepID=UPI003716BDCB